MSKTYQKQMHLKAQTGSNGNLYCFSLRLGVLLYQLLVKDGCSVKMKVMDESVCSRYMYDFVPLSTVDIEIDNQIFLFSICHSKETYNRSFVQRLALLLKQNGFEVVAQHKDNAHDDLIDAGNFGGTAINEFEIRVLDTLISEDTSNVSDFLAVVKMVFEGETDICWDARDFDYELINRFRGEYKWLNFVEDKKISKVFYINKIKKEGEVSA